MNAFLLSVLVFGFSFLLTALSVRILVPKLSGAVQPILKEGPAWHMKKTGTPTMGGLAFLLTSAIVGGGGVAALSLSGFTKEGVSFGLTLAFALLSGGIGVADDAAKLRKKENKGLSAKQKLLLQFFITALFLAARHTLLGSDTVLRFSFGSFDLGNWYYPIAALVTVGIVNFANLTDGVDGLASCVAFGIGLSLFYLGARLGYAVSLAGALMLGIPLGFLLYNIHPAKIFMGDTGSLFLGGLAAGAAFLIGNPFSSVLFGGVYVLEGLSVILQVAWYKLSGKRLFAMAPIHHALEKHGFSENRICVLALLLTAVFSLPVYWVFFG